MKNEHLITMWEAEKSLAEANVLSQIENIRKTLNYLEDKIKDGKQVFESDGLQGHSSYLDNYLIKMLTYQKTIEGLKKVEE